MVAAIQHGRLPQRMHPAAAQAANHTARHLLLLLPIYACAEALRLLGGCTGSSHPVAAGYHELLVHSLCLQL